MLTCLAVGDLAYYHPRQTDGAGAAVESYSEIEPFFRMIASTSNIDPRGVEAGRMYQYDAFDITCGTARYV
jgi:hypothetical protein